MAYDTNPSYPGINYCGNMSNWMKIEDPDNLGLLFVFDHINYFPSSKSAFGNILMQKYGSNTFDGMRIVNTLDHYLTVVEAHFLKAGDRQNVILESLDRRSKTINEDKVIGDRAWLTVKSPLPLTAAFKVFALEGIPLGQYEERRDVIKRRVLAMIFRLKGIMHNTEKKDIEIKHLVDIVPGAAYNKYFNGSVTIVLRNIMLKEENLHLTEYGNTLAVSSFGTHYLYCSKCQRLDSHYQDDFPFPNAANDFEHIV